MKLDRRDFFLGVPGGLAGLGLFAEIASPQTPNGVGADPAAVDFWVKQMGVSPAVLPPPGARRSGPNGASGLTPGQQEADNEPFFLYFDEQAGVLIPADQLKPDQLDGDHEKGADAKVTFTKNRLRFGDADQRTFDKYSSSGLYLETQQHPSAPSPNYGAMGWSLLSAILPSMAKKPGSTAAKGASPSAPAAPAPAQPAAAGPSASAAAAASATQSVLLPSGIGQTALSCFVKDRRQSRFGQFIAMLIPPASLAQPFAPVLAMPAIGMAALSAVRTIVASLSTHAAGDQAGDQVMVFQQGPRTVVGIRDSPMATEKDTLKLRTGTYLLVPKREVNYLSGKFSDYRIYDGYLVGKKVDEAGTYEAQKQTLTAMTYLTLDVKVERTKMGGGCTNTKA